MISAPFLLASFWCINAIIKLQEFAFQAKSITSASIYSNLPFQFVPRHDFCGRCSCFGEQYRQIVCILREDDIVLILWKISELCQFKWNVFEHYFSIKWYHGCVFIFVIRKLKSLSLSLFRIDIGYGNKLVGLRQETKLRQDSKGTRSSFKFISQQCFHYFFMLASLIVHSVVFLPMTIELSTISYKNNNKHYHITHNDRTFLN